MAERNAERTKHRILESGIAEFSSSGIAGARVDSIAARAQTNKRMIYEYFGSKEDLYKAVLLNVFNAFAAAEGSAIDESASLPCAERVRRLLKFYFTYPGENPEFVTLLLWENLNCGEYIAQTDYGAARQSNFAALRAIIDCGKSSGEFSSNVDADQIILDFLTFPFSYYSNHYTLSKLLGFELTSDERLDARLEHITGTIISYLTK